MNVRNNREHNTRLVGQAFAAESSTAANRLTASSTMVFDVSLQKATARRTCSEEEIGQIVTQESLYCPLPSQLLRTVQRSVTDVRRAVTQLEEEAKELLYQVLPPRTCYYVFHNGDYHFYPNQLPQEVYELRKTVLFWINYAANEFFSRGKQREKLEIGSRALSMLYVLCYVQNAGRIISSYS